MNDDSELGRLLHGTFGKAGWGEEGESGLGDFALMDQSQGDSISFQGHIPGTTYDGGPQRQEGGLKGRREQARSDKLDALLGGVDIKKYYPWCDPVVLDCYSRMLETTFRMFQITCRAPSHIEPPFIAQPFDVFTAGPVVIAPAAGTFITLATFQVPPGRFRGEAVFVGHSADTGGAFADLTFRLTVDGTPRPPWNSARGLQLWDMVPPTRLCTPIHLQSRQTIALQVENFGAVNHEVQGRLCGWTYLVRAETSDGSVRPTIVD